MMRVHRRPMSFLLRFVLATSLVVSTSPPTRAASNPPATSEPSLVVSTSPPTRAASNPPTTSEPAGTETDTSPYPSVGVSRGADLVLSPTASPGNNSFDELEAVYLWTRSHTSDDKYEMLNPNQPLTITNSSFLQSSKTYLLLHGFLDKGTAKWILKLKAKLLDLEDCNVLAVQYNAGVINSNESFANISVRIPFVGAQTAGLLKLLVELRQQDLRQLHIIGHCLGAHVGGIAGFAAKSPVGRITGLDPAGLTFNDASHTMRLSSEDADFVDVIHTGGCHNIYRWGDCMGIDIAIGHSDFWPNRGDYQPACHRSSGRHHTDHKCNHIVSQDYFLESFSYGTDRTLFLARPDVNYEHFCHSVQCGDFPQYMGIHARKINNQLDYFLNTSDKAPFAELDPSCPSLLSWHLIKGSSIAAIVLLAIGLLLVVLPAVALLFNCAKNHFVVQTVPFSPFGEHGTPPTADHCSPRSQSYGERRARGIDDSPSNCLGQRLLDSPNASSAEADERSIVSRNNWSPPTSGGRAGQRNTSNYGGGGNEVLAVGGGELLSDEDFQDCSASGIDQPVYSPLAPCRLILRNEPVDHHDEPPEDEDLEGDSDRHPTTLQHVP